MKIIILTFLFIFSFTKFYGQETDPDFVTSDIDNFWTAYDKITATKDSSEQYYYLNTLFLKKASPGQLAIMQARNYSASSFIDAINNYPLFWRSIRKNTFKAKAIGKELKGSIIKLKTLYPQLKPAKIYFTIGAFMTGGTTLEGMVLIGSELAMGDKNTITSEFPETYGHLRSFFDGNPVNNLAFSNVHEYIHTQQKTTIGNSLLAQSVLEGVAEFITVLSTGQKSTTPAIAFGKQHDARIKQVFASQMFNPFTGYWLYSNEQNEFKVRDLGYYTGYAICEKYYESARDKNKAIKEMIELDYNNELELNRFVNHAGYFSSSLEKLKEDYDRIRPSVQKINEFSNGSIDVDPRTTQLTISFSVRMDQRFRNFEYGPLGETNVLRLKRFIGYSDDGKSATFEIELKPNQRYQLLVGGRFRDEKGYSLQPYLIDFETADKSE
ncbi:hypothetical protein GZH53_03080 [Flavihumibacter sp. R14]|nr:hypothetical protein [Flavihumibacter soli]